MLAYKRRKTLELRELANAISYAHHAPDKINEVLTDESELTDKAEAAGFETDTEQYWE